MSETGETMGIEVAEEGKNTTSGKPRTFKKDTTEKILNEEEETGTIEETVFVLPGDFIGTNEEFTPGFETFVNGSDIYSLVTGTVNVNKKKRTISVIPSTTTPPVIKEGDIVVGEIVNVRDSMVLVRIGAVKGAGERAFQAPGAAIHVSNVKDAYVKDISNEFGMSDIVKARVLNLENMRLTTSRDDLGVMKVLCSACHAPMVRDNSNDKGKGSDKGKLKCQSCGNIQRRKIASGYGTGIV
ncbi:MAG: exosome complex RNA-binding protein Csl4 [Methanosarcinaceae archaeon]